MIENKIPEYLENTKDITDIILAAKEKAYKETSADPEPSLTTKIDWPVQCTIGPGLEGAIACETKIGYVNGTKGWLIYQGYDIFDLCAYSTYEEVSYLLLHGELPTPRELAEYKWKLAEYRDVNETERLLMGFPVEQMHPMAALRLGTNLMRQKQTYRDEDIRLNFGTTISTDEDSIPMETIPYGESRAIYEFQEKIRPPQEAKPWKRGSEGLESCYHIIAGVPSILASVGRLRKGHLPLEPRKDLSHAANFLYMLTGRVPTHVEERILDICLILHADHGLNASTFAAMVVASTLSDIYFSMGAGIAALNGPLHGGANEQVIKTLQEIGAPENVKQWVARQQAAKQKIPGFGHRVYKAYDPRARILGPLAGKLAEENEEAGSSYKTALALEKEVLSDFGEEKKIFPNVDFYSGLVYQALGISTELFTPIFAMSRVAGWSARVLEYLQNNRIFRPRGIYIGDFDKKYKDISRR